MTTIVTKPVTPEYEESWDRIFKGIPGSKAGDIVKWRKVDNKIHKVDAVATEGCKCTSTV